LRNEVTDQRLFIMDSSRTSALRRIWADASPLAKFIEERAKGLPVEDKGATEPMNPSDPLSTRQADSAPRWANLARYAELVAVQRIARDRAWDATLSDLIAERLMGLGRRPGSQDIEPIDASHWIGADVGGDTLSRGEVKFIDIRVAEPEVVQAIEPKPHSGLGRPSEVEAIQKAISAYAKTDPELKRPPDVRHRAYRKDIASQGQLSGVNNIFRWRLSFLPVFGPQHRSTIGQPDAEGVRSSC
jgi:hypothetical protein